MVDFDRILDRLGALKKWQIYHYVLVGLAGITTGMHALAYMFLFGVPDHGCNEPDLGETVSAADRQRISFPVSTDTNGRAEYSSCYVFDRDYTEDNINKWILENRTYTQDDLDVRGCGNWSYSSDIYGKTTVTQWNLVCGQSWKRATAQSLFMVGFMMGAFIFGYISDKFGRKKGFLSAIITMVVSGTVAAFAPEYWSHVLLRLVTGAATAGYYTAGFVLCMEVIGVEKRMVPAIWYQGWFCIGEMLDALLGYLIRDYVIYQLVISLLPAVFLSYYWLLGESPRWLITHGRMAEAKKELDRAVRMNKVKGSIDDLLEEAVNEEKPIANDTTDHASQGNTQQEVRTNYTIIDLLRTPNLRKISLNVFFNWLVNSLVFYGLALSSSDLVGSPYVNLFISALVEIPGYFLCTFMCDRIGRRLSLAAFMVTGGCMLLVTVGIPSDQWVVITGLAMVGKLCISASFAVIYIFSGELFPTVVRTIGVGSGSMCARVGGLLAPFVADLGKLAWGPLPVLIFGVSSAAGGLLALLLPETLHQKLPETIAEVETFAKDWGLRCCYIPKKPECHNRDENEMNTKPESNLNLNQNCSGPSIDGKNNDVV